MLSSSSLNHSDSSNNSFSEMSGGVMFKSKQSEPVEAKPKKSSGSSKLFSIDSILKPHCSKSQAKKSKSVTAKHMTFESDEIDEYSNECEQAAKKSLKGVDSTLMSSSSSTSSSSSSSYNSNKTPQFNPASNFSFLNEQNLDQQQQQQQQQKNLLNTYDQFFLNNIQNTFFKNCFSNPSAQAILLSNLTQQQSQQQQQLSDLIVPNGLGQSFAHLTQQAAAAAIANNYFFHSNKNNSSSLSSSSSSLSSSSDLSKQLSPSLSPVTNNLNNNNNQACSTMSQHALNSSSNNDSNGIGNKLNMLAQQQSTDIKNYFSNMPNNLNASQFHKLGDLTSGFVQNSPFPNYNPFLGMNANNSKTILFNINK